MAGDTSGTGSQGFLNRRALLQILSGSAGGQAVVILATPFLTRLYSPDEFGAYTAFVAVTAVLGVSIVMRIDAAVPLPRSNETAVGLAWFAMIVVAVLAVVAWLLGFIVAAPLADAIGVPTLDDYWWLVCATSAVIGVFQIMSSWMVRAEQYGQLAIRNGLMGVGQVGTQITLGIGNSSPLGLMLGLTSGRLLAIGGLAGRRGLLAQRRPSWRTMLSAISEYRRFPLVTSWSAALNSLGPQLPLLIMSAVYGQLILGLLGLAIRVLAAPAALLGQAVAKVFQGQASRLIRDQTGGLASLILSNSRLLSVAALPVVVVIVALGQELFALIFGNQWRESGDYARVLVIGYAFQLVASPISHTMLLLERQWLQLAWDVSRLALVVAAPLIAYAAGLPASGAVWLLSGAYCVTYVALWLACLRLARGYDARVTSSS